MAATRAGPATPSSPTPAVAGGRDTPPLWSGAALLLSGLFLMIVETPNLLFFLGAVFVIAGVYALVARHSVRAPEPRRVGYEVAPPTHP